MVVIAIIVVINTSHLTTTKYSVVKQVTTGIHMWSLLQLTTELLTTMDDHIFVVVTNF